MKAFSEVFESIVSVENLFRAWDVFKQDKRNKEDVLRFEWQLEDNIFELHRELKNRTYRHEPYTSFCIRDPKQRHIHKAIVRDRVLHHAIFSIINPIFEPTFISTSFSCRVGYGTHKGVEKLACMVRKISKNNTRPCFVLKCDIKKFFDSVDHEILLSILGKRIKDESTMWLLDSIVRSYASAPTRERERDEKCSAKGIPIGNLTSQLFANVYMNEFDQFIKHVLKVKNYIRYTDDFVIVADSKVYVENLLPRIAGFLKRDLGLTLHPKKISIRRLYQGVDFLGYVVFPHHRLLRTKTKQRIFKKLRRRFLDYKRGLITSETFEQSLQSYLGVLSHANTYRLSEKLKNQLWF